MKYGWTIVGQVDHDHVRAVPERVASHRVALRELCVEVSARVAYDFRGGHSRFVLSGDAPHMETSVRALADAPSPERRTPAAMTGERRHFRQAPRGDYRHRSGGGSSHKCHSP